MRYGKIAATLALALVVLLALAFWSATNRPGANATQNWAGVDETVVEKYAADAGRAASPPILNTESGDLLLFIFTLSGAAAGFAAGYCWRMLMGEKKSRS